MWTMFNRFKSIKDTQFTYEIDTYAGQSGSGIWISERGEPYLLGVHTAGNQALEENIGTRISTAYFLKLHEQMSRTGALKTALVRSIGAPPPIAGVAIPDIAIGHEAVYQQFLRGKLIYKPNEDNDNGRKEFRIGDLANPLSGTFDIRGCGYSDQYLSISTGFRTGQNPANKYKIEIWIVPQFVLQKDWRAKPYNEFLQKLDGHRNKPFAILFNGGTQAGDDYEHDVTGVIRGGLVNLHLAAECGASCIISAGGRWCEPEDVMIDFRGHKGPIAANYGQFLANFFIELSE